MSGNALKIKVYTADPVIKEQLAKPGAAISLGNGHELEVTAVTQKRDFADIKIIELLLHFPIAVAAHFVAAWLHQKLSGTKSNLSIAGEEVQPLTLDNIESAVQNAISKLGTNK